MVEPVYEIRHKLNAIIIVLMLSFFPIGVGLIGAEIYILYWIVVEGGSLVAIITTVIYSFGGAAFCLILGWLFICRTMTHYRFETDGLHVKYPLQSWSVIGWDEFQQVCVLNTFIDNGADPGSPAICCVKKGEKKNSVYRWKTDNIFKYRSVICIPYSPQLHEGIKRMCPYEVEDLRETLPYRSIRSFK